MKHRKFSRGRSISLLAVAALSAAGTLTAVVGASTSDATSDPAHNGNIVAFGDSFTANPDQFHNTLRDIPGAVGE